MILRSSLQRFLGVYDRRAGVAGQPGYGVSFAVESSKKTRPECVVAVSEPHGIPTSMHV